MRYFLSDILLRLDGKSKPKLCRLGLGNETKQSHGIVLSNLRSSFTKKSNIIKIYGLPKITLEERMEVFKVMRSNQVRDVGRNEVEGSLRFTLDLPPMSIGDFSWGGAGLFNLSAAFKFVGEPAPTVNPSLQWGGAGLFNCLLRLSLLVNPSLQWGGAGLFSCLLRLSLLVNPPLQNY